MKSKTLHSFLLLFFFLFQHLQAQNDAYDEQTCSFSKSDSVVLSFLSGKGVEATQHNQIKLLKSGEEKFEDLFAAIRTAKHHIHMEYFNFRNDSIANSLFDLLALKVHEGVKIRILYDAFGNWSNNKPLKKRHLRAIRNNGIEIEAFDPLKFPYLNHISLRDHRKIVVIDGKTGYTGGMNVADYYIHGIPEIGKWRDMHIRIDGEAVKELQDIFLTIWNKRTKQNIEGEIYYPALEDSLLHHSTTVAMVDRAPRKTPKLMRQVYATSIRSAEDKIQIVNPYFLPTSSVRKELKKAINNGIKVEIMLSSKADIGFTPEGSLYVAHKLMKRGAEVFLYNEGFHHSKVMMVDHSFSTVGSTNLDSRSLRYDYEINAFIFDKKVTEELIEIFEEDKKSSTLLTQEVWRKRSKWKRFVGWFANLLTPVL